MREHPYWRSEQMQRLMNLTTPRTHQFAVWLTIGFFEVTRQGDLGMLAVQSEVGVRHPGTGDRGGQWEEHAISRVLPG